MKSIKLLDQFHAGQYLVVDGKTQVEVGQTISIDKKSVKVLEIIRGARGRIGLKVCPIEHVSCQSE